MNITLLKALSSPEGWRAFRVHHWDDDDFDENCPAQWNVTPLPDDVLTAEEGFFLISGHHVLPSGDTEECLLDLSMPERISDFAYFRRGECITRLYHHECEGDVIAGLPIDGFGVYELFYSRRKPDLGIAVLREGLSRSDRKAFIAEDLGYILRDEGRLGEAAEAFSISAAEGPSSYFIYQELADLHERLGHPDEAKHFRDKCPGTSAGASLARKWWQFWIRV